MSKTNQGILLLLIQMALSSAIFSQQDTQYTQYIYSTSSINPAYAGSRNGLSLAALHRSQWAGLDGAPTTLTLNVHSPIGYRGVSLGFSILNEQIGPTSETYFDVDFSYTIKLDRSSNLALGLKASTHFLDVRFSALNQDTSMGYDILLQQDIDNKFSPNVGAGLFYYTNTFYAGISVPRILETKHFKASSISTASERSTYYIMAGHITNVNPSLQFKPAILTKVVMGAPLQIDVSANFMMNDKFLFGVGYRWDAAWNAIFGFNLSDGILLGLAYDREVTALGNTEFNAGSFEVLLRFELLKEYSRNKKQPFF